MTGLRIEATKDEFSEIERRLKYLFCVYQSMDKLYPTTQRGISLFKDGKPLYWKYFRVYVYDPNTLIDQLDAALRDANFLAQENARLSFENQSLKQKLGLQPQPGPYDVVLGNQRKVNDDEF